MGDFFVDFFFEPGADSEVERRRALLRRNAVVLVPDTVLTRPTLSLSSSSTPASMELVGESPAISA